MTKEEIELGIKCCEDFICGECPYEKYDDGHYKLRCVHILMKDINKLHFGGKEKQQ